jgi:hypothetical protein
MKLQQSGDSVQSRLQSAALGFQALPTEVGTAERCRPMLAVKLNSPMSPYYLEEWIPPMKSGFRVQ